MPLDLTQFAWRDGILLLAVAVGIYLAIMLLRLLQVGQRKPRGLDFVATAEQPAANDAAARPAAAEATDMTFHFPLTPVRVNVSAETLGQSYATTNAPANVATPSFADALNANRFEQEVRDLRTEVAALREELTELEVSRRVSPQYADAMALAQRGFDAQGIAEHCAISRGEAELVMALARGSFAAAAAAEKNEEDDYVGFGFRGVAAAG